jgi:erythronate-4-phosphate dehydrogenase
VGVGNVGSRVAVKARAAGMEVILNDPPLAAKTGEAKYRPLDEIFAADFVTMHVPLEKAGPHPTHHMADASFFKRLGPGKGFINASRGGVHDTAALKAAIAKKGLLFCALDVWEKEPEIDLDLLAAVDIATPHIAGYSFEGKVNGTGMIYDAACGHFGVTPVWKRASVLGTPRTAGPAFTGRYEDDLRAAVRGNYDIFEDDRSLRAEGRPGAIGPGFDRLRKEYRVRREFTNTALKVGRDTDPGLVRTLRDLLFNVTTEGGTL